MIRTITLTIVFIATLAAQNTAPDEPGSISGVVVNAATGKPIADLKLVVHASGNYPSAETDVHGRYTLERVPPGRYPVGLAALLGDTFSSTKLVNVAAGEHVRSLNFRVYPNQSVSGRVVNENDEPLSDVEVVLLGREYYMGELRYYRHGIATTNDQGEYRIEGNVPPGTGWLVWARPLNRQDLPAVSDAPEDPKLRERTMAPTYYPNAATAEQAGVLILGAGEQRESVDIELTSLPSYCLEAQIDDREQTGDLRFSIQGVQPSFRFGVTGGVTGNPPGGPVGPDGRIRICELWPADYRLTAFSGDAKAPVLFGTTLVSITDGDIKDVTVVAQPPLPLSGRVSWAAEPPEKPIEAKLGILLHPLHRTVGGRIIAVSSLPGEFAFQAAPVMDEYAVRFFPGLPEGVYVKDVTYGGVSILHRPLRLDIASEGFELRAVVDRDGGVLKARVSDDENHLIGDATVVLIPKEATTHPRLAETRVTGRTDQNGEYASRGLPPGAYYVVATEGDFTDLSPESVSTLFDARSKAEEVEIGPNATVELTLEPLKLTR